MDKNDFKAYVEKNKPDNFWSLDFSGVLQRVESNYTMTQIYNLCSGYLPSVLTVSDFDSESFLRKIIEECALKSDRLLISDDYRPHEDRCETDATIILLTKEIFIIVKPLSYCMTVYFSHNISPDILSYIKEMAKKFPLQDIQDSNMYVVVNDGPEIQARLIRMPMVKKLQVEKAYNEDFLPVHETITKRLSEKGSKGMVLLHGIPGTGKTHYIRYLMSIVKKRFMVISSEYASYLGTKEFMTFLLNFRDSILIIEDAEEAIKSRDQGVSAVANLLNLTDGLLSDALNIQVIVTFNCDLKKVDKALLRKGRLIARYEFGKLCAEKSQALSDSLGFTTKIESDMTLAEIYNQSEANYVALEKEKIGFKK